MIVPTRISLRFAIPALVAVLSGCAAGGAPPTNPAGIEAAASSVGRPLASAYTGTTAGASSLQRALRLSGHGWISPEAKAGKNVLYVSSYDDGYVSLYSLKGNNQSPIGQITAGLDGPEGMAVDRKLNLYVTNTSNNTVTVYAPGTTSPSSTYSQGLDEPAGVTVGKDGTVYVTNLAGSIVEYAPGSMSPERTISIEFPIAPALDTKNNLYVTSLAGVYEYAPGSTQGTNLNIELDSPGGIAIDNASDIVVADQTLPGIEVFPPGQSSPSQTFGQTDDPNPIAFDKKANTLYVGEPTHNVVNVYAYPSGTQTNTISNGVVFDAGVAVSPESKY